MIKDLEKLGLTNGEAKVYIALLKLGASTVGPVHKLANVAYSNIYDILERLIDKGFVSFYLKQKTKYFQAAKPNRITDFLEEQEQLIQEQKRQSQKLIEQLEILKEPTSQSAQIFVGTKGLRTAYEKLLLPFKKRTFAYYIYVYDKNTLEATDQFFDKQKHWMRAAKVKWKGVSSQEYRNSKFLAKVLDMTTTRFTSSPLPCNIDIYGTQALIVSWSQTPVGILIESEEFVNSFTLFFEKLWKSAKK